MLRRNKFSDRILCEISNNNIDTLRLQRFLCKIFKFRCILLGFLITKVPWFESLQLITERRLSGCSTHWISTSNSHLNQQSCVTLYTMMNNSTVHTQQKATKQKETHQKSFHHIRWCNGPICIGQLGGNHLSLKYFQFLTCRLRTPAIWLFMALHTVRTRPDIHTKNTVTFCGPLRKGFFSALLAGSQVLVITLKCRHIRFQNSLNKKSREELLLNCGESIINCKLY